MAQPIRGGGSGKHRSFAPRIKRPVKKPTHFPPSAPNRGTQKPDPSLKPSGGDKGWKHLPGNSGPKVDSGGNASGGLKHTPPSPSGPKIPSHDTDVPPTNVDPNLRHGTPPYRGPLYLAQPSAGGQAAAAGLADNYASAFT